MAEETQYITTIGVGVVNTANSNLDGTGALSTVLTAGAKGTLIKSVTIKSQNATTSMGMIRLFVYDGTNTRLLTEVEVINTTQSATTPTFEKIIQLNFSLQANYILKASTQNSEIFNIIAEGLEWTYYSGAVRPDTTEFTIGTGGTIASVANSNIDGTGTCSAPIWDTNTSVPTFIKSITIKAQGDVTDGMIRLFITDTTFVIYLFREITVQATTSSSGTSPSFEKKIVFPDNLYLGNFNSGNVPLTILATTQNGEPFAISVEGATWSYAP